MSLTFDQLRKVNLARSNEVFHPQRGIEEWTPSDWATAMAGECGEACNQVKKLRRLATAPEAHAHMHPDDQRDYAQCVKSVGEELADVVIYADLLAARLGIDLGTAVARKFDAVSTKLGCPHRLGTVHQER